MADAPRSTESPRRRLEIGVGEEEAGLRLDRALQRKLPELSRSRLKQLILSGQVASPDVPPERILRDPALRVHAGQNFVVTIPEAEPASPAAQPLPLALPFAAGHLLAIYNA